MQENDEKSFFDLYSGSKEIDVLEKFGIGPVILKKVLYALCHCIDHIKRYTCCLPLQTYAGNQQVNCFFLSTGFWFIYL